MIRVVPKRGWPVITNNACNHDQFSFQGGIITTQYAITSAQGIHSSAVPSKAKRFQSNKFHKYINKLLLSFILTFNVHSHANLMQVS